MPILHYLFEEVGYIVFVFVLIKDICYQIFVILMSELNLDKLDKCTTSKTYIQYEKKNSDILLKYFHPQDETRFS